MKNLRKKTGCLVMAVLLLIMTFVPAMSVTVSAAANIEGRLITVGGKTVNSIVAQLSRQKSKIFIMN